MPPGNDDWMVDDTEKGDRRFEGGDVELHKKEDGKTGNERGES